MRGKIIKAFLGVYLALSMVYGGIRAAYLTAVAAMAPPEEPAVLAAEPSFGQTAVTAQLSLAPTVTPSAEPTEKSSAAPTGTPAPSAPPTAEPAPALEVPSLEDYLSQFHCGGCGRNCLLSSPRCWTGKRKAETYTAEYYTEYGTTDEI